ncbi:hypothetical protein CRUP_006136 [Coryphaenoides rupestris]|nr:hypothetical protein CRUP_006136 [Coryphaenoides rupestris]
MMVPGASGSTLSRGDCLCSVCLEVFLEPVTLPCNHSFCKPCFLQSVAQTSLCCPLCRTRFSSWARLHSRRHTLVNQELWRKVQNSFPLQCQRRLSGEVVEEEEAQGMPCFLQSVAQTSLCCPLCRTRVLLLARLHSARHTLVNQELWRKLEEERRAGEEEERRASEEFIQHLLQEEEQRLAQERRRQEEELEADQRLAHLLNQELV